AVELRRRGGPAERGERPQRRREPRVEHVRVADELGRAALRARVRLGPRADPMAVGTRPDRDLVAPPELPRDAPGGRLLERLDRETVLALGMKDDLPRAERLDRRRGKLGHHAPPLRRHERLDARVAALTRADRVAVVLALVELVVLLQPRDDALVDLGLG